MYVTFSSPICSAANRHGLDSDLVSSSTRVDLCITAMRSVPRSCARGTLTVTYNRPIYVTGTLGRAGVIDTCYSPTETYIYAFLTFRSQLEALPRFLSLYGLYLYRDLFPR